ncbi:hypothetical protein DFH09DRAFT_1082426 [Mycena vulgaris]|nr:hypothetical protein DFH09DRAFT_1082426 [Mycena vulgaris]
MRMVQVTVRVTLIVRRVIHLASQVLAAGSHTDSAMRHREDGARSVPTSARAPTGADMRRVSSQFAGGESGTKPALTRWTAIASVRCRYEEERGAGGTGARAGRHRVPVLAAMRYGMRERATAVLEGIGTKSNARGEASCPRTHGDAAGDVVREARRSGPAARARSTSTALNPCVVEACGWVSSLSETVSISIRPASVQAQKNAPVEREGTHHRRSHRSLKQTGALSSFPRCQKARMKARLFSCRRCHLRKNQLSWKL